MEFATFKFPNNIIIPAGYYTPHQAFDILGKAVYGDDWTEDELLCESNLPLAKKKIVEARVRQVTVDPIMAKQFVQNCRNSTESNADMFSRMHRYESIRKEILGLLMGEAIIAILLDQNSGKKINLPADVWVPGQTALSYSFTTGNGYYDPGDIRQISGLLEIKYQGLVFFKKENVDKFAVQLKQRFTINDERHQNITAQKVISITP
ncbi:MAG: hypothetical protein JSS50_03555 [Proteobacteria bacterium]|nr:hypothetical protein [Pseudomonadota bacterium]